MDNIWHIASLPLWGLATLFLVYTILPRGEFRTREKFPVHVVMCLIVSTLLGVFAAVVWDGALRLGMIVSLPFWLIAGACVVGTVGAVKNPRPGETHADLAVQGVIGTLFTGILSVLAALVWRFV